MHPGNPPLYFTKPISSPSSLQFAICIAFSLSNPKPLKPTTPQIQWRR